VNDTQNATLFVFYLATEHPGELEIMRLTTLEARRLRGNFIETLEIIPDNLYCVGGDVKPCSINQS